MPKRPRQHEIDELAQRVFRESLPPSWIVNQFTVDYAKDFIVEIVDTSNVTGVFFVVQLKGKESLGLRENKHFASIPIDRDHLRYYKRDVPLPVFIVAVDVTTKKAFFEFVQKQLPTNLDGEGVVSFRVHTSNVLSDTIRLNAAIDSAWLYMRDKYPGSIAAAIDFRKRYLKKIEPRFDYEISVIGNNEKVTLIPKEEVTCRLSFTGKKDAVQSTFLKFLGEGRKVRASSDVEIKIEGSPLFDSHGGMLSAISFHPNVSVEVSVFTRSGKFGATMLPEFRGRLKGGFKQLRFKGVLDHCPLTFEITMMPPGESPGGRIIWRWNSDAWIGKSLLRLPWLDILYSFVVAAEEHDCTLGIRFSSQGAQITEATSRSNDSVRRLTEVKPLLQTLIEARHVCRVLDLDPRFPLKVCDGDVDDVEELFNLVTTGEYISWKQINFSFTVNQLPESEVRDVLASKGPIRVTESYVSFNLFGEKFDYSAIVVELSEWEDIKIGETQFDGLQRSQITLVGCKQKFLWPRFRESPRPIGS